MTKSTILALLVCANLLLFAALCLATYSPPVALAQGAGPADNYLVATGEVQDQHDVLYVIDERERTLHVFLWDRGRKKLVYSDFRSLERDFRDK